MRTPSHRGNAQLSSIYFYLKRQRNAYFLKRLTSLFQSGSLHFSQSPTFQALGLTYFFPIHSLFQGTSTSLWPFLCQMYPSSSQPPCYSYLSLNICMSSDPTTSVLSIYPKETHRSVHLQVLECSS